MKHNMKHRNTESSIARSQTFPSIGTVERMVNDLESSRFKQVHYPSSAPSGITPGIVEQLVRSFDRIKHRVSTPVKTNDRFRLPPVRSNTHPPSTPVWAGKVFSYCKRLVTPTTFLPGSARDLVHSREHFRAGRRMVRLSPEKDAGLLSVLNSSSSRIKSFTFSEFLNYSYLVDNCYLVLYCMTIGYTIWLYNITADFSSAEMIDMMDVNPIEIANFQNERWFTHLATEDLIPHILKNTNYSPESSLDNVIKDLLLKDYYNREETRMLIHRRWDPLEIPADIPHNNLINAKSLSLMLGGIILAVLLNESVQPHAAAI